MDTLKKEHHKYSGKILKPAQIKKLVGFPEAGKMVRIYWEEGVIDYGYLFSLPDCDESDFDYFVHVPKPDNSSGIGDAPQVWQHINNILSNDLVKKVTVARRSLF